VQVTPPVASCSNAPGSTQACDYSYRIGSTVTLEATASPDSVFLGWGPGPCTGTEPCVVTVDEATGVGASFRGPQTLSLTVTGTGGASGFVTVSPGGSVCQVTPAEPQAVCTSAHRIGTVVTLTASTGSGSTLFVGWTGCTSGTNVCTLTMDDEAAMNAGVLWDRDHGRADEDEVQPFEKGSRVVLEEIEELLAAFVLVDPPDVDRETIAELEFLAES
jgi:hypothetical protein